jgi:hypothetical protein
MRGGWRGSRGQTSRLLYLLTAQVGVTTPFYPSWPSVGAAGPVALPQRPRPDDKNGGPCPGPPAPSPIRRMSCAQRRTVDLTRNLPPCLSRPSARGGPTPGGGEASPPVRAAQGGLTPGRGGPTSAGQLSPRQRRSTSRPAQALALISAPILLTTQLRQTADMSASRCPVSRSSFS